MRVLELAKRRKTVRQFLSPKPPMDAIMRAIEAAKKPPRG